MIPHGVEIFFSVERIDMRWGFNRLSGVVAEKVGRDVRCGALFLFMGRSGSALKILFFDGTGLCLFYKRLDAGVFRVPSGADDPARQTIAIDEDVLNALLDGVDIEAPLKKKEKTSKGRREILH